MREVDLLLDRVPATALTAATRGGGGGGSSGRKDTKHYCAQLASTHLPPSAQTTPLPLLEGYLKKRSRGGGLRGHKWLNRYWTLTPTSLMYWRSRKHCNAHQQQRSNSSSGGGSKGGPTILRLSDIVSVTVEGRAEVFLDDLPRNGNGGRELAEVMRALDVNADTSKRHHHASPSPPWAESSSKQSAASAGKEEGAELMSGDNPVAALPSDCNSAIVIRFRLSSSSPGKGKAERAGGGSRKENAVEGVKSKVGYTYRTLYLQAENIQRRQAWVTALRQVLRVGSSTSQKQGPGAPHLPSAFASAPALAAQNVVIPSLTSGPEAIAASSSSSSGSSSSDNLMAGIDVSSIVVTEASGGGGEGGRGDREKEEGMPPTLARNSNSRKSNNTSAATTLNFSGVSAHSATLTLRNGLVTDTEADEESSEAGEGGAGSGRFGNFMDIEEECMHIRLQYEELLEEVELRDAHHATIVENMRRAHQRETDKYKSTILELQEMHVQDQSLLKELLKAVEQLKYLPINPLHSRTRARTKVRGE